MAYDGNEEEGKGSVADLRDEPQEYSKSSVTGIIYFGIYLIKKVLAKV
jgi:hypothetical protein